LPHLSACLHQEWNEKELPLYLNVSNDPGRFLCNYSYYKGLQLRDHMHSKFDVLFVHVPENNQPYTTEQVSSILVLLIKQLVLSREERHGWKKFTMVSVKPLCCFLGITALVSIAIFMFIGLHYIFV
jgi:hypothetical protein